MKARQGKLPLEPRFKWGGARRNAGRKRAGGREGVAHRARPFHDGNHPAHVTWRVLRDVPNLRGKRMARAVGETIRSINKSHAARRTSFRIVHFSIQPNHLHLIVEAGSKRTMMSALRGLGVWLARRLNKARGARGRILADRYHARPLATPREVRNAIVYVLQNHLHHQPSAYVVDECSSARWFTGWAEPLPPPDTPSPTREPTTWLLRVGWKRHGPISFTERPAR